MKIYILYKSIPILLRNAILLKHSSEIIIIKANDSIETYFRNNNNHSFLIMYKVVKIIK